MLHWKYPSLASQKTRVRLALVTGEQILAFPAKASDSSTNIPVLSLL